MGWGTISWISATALYSAMCALLAYRVSAVHKWQEPFDRLLAVVCGKASKALKRFKPSESSTNQDSDNGDLDSVTDWKVEFEDECFQHTTHL